jgi:DNA-binding CsgD family transcriptional regulator
MHAHVLGALEQRGGLAALGQVVAGVGRPGFAGDALRALNRIMRVGSWSVYRVWSDRPPVMYLSASHGVADTTQDCFRTYRDGGLYRRDRSFDLVRQQRTGDAVMLRMHADEVPSADHRNAIYLRHAVVERLSLAWTMPDHSLLAMNLYHHAHQGRFGAAEVQQFADAAPVLRAAVARHIEWQGGEGQGSEGPGGQARAGVRARLQQRCEALTGRELDVLERLLRGLTYDGIAADLGLTVSTVKTYRARAFERLGIHFKNQLFAILQA